MISRHPRENAVEANNGGEADDGGGGGGKGSKDEEECDKEVWNTLSDSFRWVQSVLDQNRVLIQHVNENHQSKLPENLTQNVALIQEINGNISRVMALYSDLSVNFATIVHQRRSVGDDGDKEKSNINSDD